MQAGDLPRETPVDLLWKRRGPVTRAQPGLRVDHRNLGVEGRERAHERRGRVTLHQDRIGALCPQDLSQPLEGVCADLCERLPGDMDVQVVIRDDTEILVDLLQHLAVLPRDGHAHPETRVFAQCQEERRHFDALGKGSVDRHDGDRLNGGCSYHNFSSGVPAHGTPVVSVSLPIRWPR